MGVPKDAAATPREASSDAAGMRSSSNEPDRPPAGRRGTPDDDVLHLERVWPGVGTWAFAPALAVLSGLAAAPLGTVVVVVVVVVVPVVVALALWRNTPTVVVTRTELRAGDARIPRSDLGAASGYDGEDARLQRGPVLDARAHLVMRGWADGVVRVEVVDPLDPTPYWLISTRRPAELAGALQPSTAA